MAEQYGTGGGIITEFRADELAEALEVRTEVFKEMPNGRTATLRSLGPAGYACYVTGHEDEDRADTLPELLRLVKAAWEEPPLSIEG